MKKYNYDKLADSLISQAEASDRLRKIGNKFPGFASMMMNLPEEEIITNELNNSLPLLFLNLNKHKEFYENKKQYNGNIANLNREIKKCVEYLDCDKKSLSLKQLRIIHFWVIEINDKYAFT